MDDEPTNVIEALVAVSAEVQAITKDKTANAGGTFKYRSIEAVLEALHPLFVKYKVLVVPTVLSAESRVHEVYGSEKGERVFRRFEYEAVMTVQYRVYGPGGPNDFVDGSVFTTSVDSSDKQTGKALSYGYKNFMFQLLCIPTAAAEDNEESGPEQSPRQAAKRGPKDWSTQIGHDDTWERIRTDLLALPDDQRKAAVDDLITEHGLFGADRKPKLPYSRQEMAVVQQVVAAYRNALIGPADHLTEALESVAQARSAVDAAKGATNQARSLLAAEPAHADHAIATMVLALNVANLGDLDEPPTPAQWYLADYENPDEIDWKQAAKAFGLSPAKLLVLAQGVANRDPELFDKPEKLDQITGDLASQLRNDLIASVNGEPF